MKERVMAIHSYLRVVEVLEQFRNHFSVCVTLKFKASLQLYAATRSNT